MYISHFRPVYLFQAACPQGPTYDGLMGNALFCDHLGMLKHSWMLCNEFAEHNVIMAARALNSEKIAETSVDIVRESCEEAFGALKGPVKQVDAPQIPAPAHGNLWLYGLILIFTAICLSSIWKKSLTYDEAAHLQFGKTALSGNLDHAYRQRMPVTALNALPVFIFQKSGISSIPEQTMTWLCRIPTIVCAVLLGIFIFTWSKHLYGILGGGLSLLCYVFCPNIVAHARLATTDLYCCLFIFISIFAFRTYIRQKTLPRLLFLSVAVGMAQLTKQTSLLLFPILGILSILEVFHPTKRRPFNFRKRYIFHFLLFVFVVVEMINVGYLFQGSFMSMRDYREWFKLNNPEVVTVLPPAWDGTILNSLETVPIPLPKAYVEAFFLGKYYNATGKAHGPIYLLGELSKFGRWYYFLVAFFLKTPISTIILISVAIWMSINSKYFSTSTDETALLMTAGIILFFFSFFTTAQIGIRYILPVYPLLYVLTGKILSLSITRRKKIALTGLSIGLVCSFMSYYPHYISYFNEVCWDRTQLYRYLADSNLDWGQNNIYLKEYLKRHTGDKPIYVNPGHPTSGRVIVSVNDLVGVTQDTSKYRWLRNNYEPVSHIAYSWLYYEIPGK